MASLPKRRYAPEFRAEAVKLVGDGVAQAESLEIVARQMSLRSQSMTVRAQPLKALERL